MAAAATCGEDFKPYSPILANLTGVCYRWGSVPTCGFTALISAQTIHDRYHLRISANSLAIGIVAIFTIVNLLGVKYTARIAMPMAVISAGLAFISSLAPVLTGKVDWQQASSFHLTSPFSGWFGDMAGLYLIGFAIPASRRQHAMLPIALMAGIDFIALPVIWLEVLGPTALGNQKPSPGPRPNLRGGLWKRGQGCSNLVCSIQHVPWNPPTACMHRSHPGSAYRGCVMVRQPSGYLTERSR